MARGRRRHALLSGPCASHAADPVAAHLEELAAKARRGHLRREPAEARVPPEIRETIAETMPNKNRFHIYETKEFAFVSEYSTQ